MTVETLNLVIGIAGGSLGLVVSLFSLGKAIREHGPRSLVDGGVIVLVIVTCLGIWFFLLQDKAATWVNSSAEQPTPNKLPPESQRLRDFANRKAPQAVGNKLPFPDVIYRDVIRTKADTLILPRFSDGTRWGLKHQDRVIEVFADNPDSFGLGMSEDQDKLIVKGSFHETTRLYFVNVDMVPSISRPIPPVAK